MTWTPYPAGSIVFFDVHCKPPDNPDGWVVRRHVIAKGIPSEESISVTTLQAARGLVPPTHSVLLEPGSGSPYLFETWVEPFPG